MKTETTISKSAEKIMSQSLMLHIEHLDRSLFDRGEQFDIDLYLLGYYLGGVGPRDLALMTWDKIKGTELDCRAMSYPHVAAVPISDKALEIIERYRAQSFGDYVLPIFSQKHQTAAQQDGCVKRLMARTNETLRKIELVIGRSPITWQGARLAVIARMFEEDMHSREIYAFAGKTAGIVEEYYSSQPWYQEKSLEQLNRSFGVCTNLG